ncbi:MAG: hypothetical protein DDT18_00399 [Actinobacteria bacterium]|nr:hypothetical protein [Actinomycetota bacterium]
MKTLYIDCFSGVSGDKMVAALLDLGVPEPLIREELAKLPLEDYRIEVRRENKASISCLQFQVIPTDSTPVFRSFTDIKDLIVASSLEQDVKKLSVDIFSELARAESKIHEIPTEQIHFHEVGAIDSIVDVVASAAGFCWLKADQIISSPVPLGKGFVEIQHGTIPIPPPAVVEILKGVPIYGSGIEVELTTPTGAAILKTVTDSYGDLPLMKVDKIGYGAGQKDLRIPNLLRILWGELVEEREILSDSLVLLSTNIDDLNPEIVGYVFQLLLEMGAKDVWITPVQMKKNRAASELSILCLPEKAREMVEIIFRETSSLGVRRTEVKRYALPRKSVEVQLPYARIKVKLGMAGGKVISISPEYEDCAQAARKTGKPLKEIYREVISEARKNLQEETSKKPDQNPSPQ